MGELTLDELKEAFRLDLTLQGSIKFDVYFFINSSKCILRD